MSGKGERFKKNNYKVPKHFLKLSNGRYIIDEIIYNSPEASQTIFVINDELKKNELFNNWISSLKFEFEVHNVGSYTDGQASSFNSTKPIVDKNSKIFVSPCDTVIFSSKVKNIFNLDVDYAAVTAKPTNFQIENCAQYGWIQSSNKDYKIFCKERPKIFSKSNVILGFFYFRNFAIFETAYNDLVRKNLKVNNEYYLDKLLEVLNTQKHSFKEVNIKNYISLGTPKEYELNKNV